LIFVLITMPVAIAVGACAAAAAENCMIGDSALCLADANCHWDGQKRGCFPGPAPAQDACAAHGDEAICDSDAALGCAWAAERKKCETKAN
jgi:hypothetical protein